MVPLIQSLPLVSIVLPAYNRVNSIRMAVESVLRQTFADFELLVVDDASTDGTMEQLADITDPRLRLLSNPRNMGVSAARNTGIRVARGDWLAFQDSDDEWMPQKLGKQMARLASADASVVVCYCGMVVAGLPDQVPESRLSVRYIPGPEHTVVEGDLSQSILARNLISTQMMVVRRRILLDADGFDEALPALVDWECMIRLSRLGTFVFVDEPLVVQYFSENSITRSREKRMRALTLILEKHHDRMAAHPAVLASHHVSLAGEKRRIGDLAGARRSLADARRIRPWDPSIWVRRARLALLTDNGRPSAPDAGG